MVSLEARALTALLQAFMYTRAHMLVVQSLIPKRQFNRYISPQLRLQVHQLLNVVLFARARGLLGSRCLRCNRCVVIVGDDVRWVSFNQGE